MTEHGEQRARQIGLYTFNGETLYVREWAARLGIKATTLGDRISNGLWTLEEALTTPMMKSGQSRKQARILAANPPKRTILLIPIPKTGGYETTFRNATGTGPGSIAPERAQSAPQIETENRSEA